MNPMIYSLKEILEIYGIQAINPDEYIESIKLEIRAHGLTMPNQTMVAEWLVSHPYISSRLRNALRYYPLEAIEGIHFETHNKIGRKLYEELQRQLEEN